MTLQGLKEKEIPILRERFGANILPAKDGFSWPVILLSQFKSPLIYILFVVGLVSLLFREYIDAALVVFVAIFNALMGFFQESSSQKTLAALKKIIKPKTVVVRDGRRKRIEASELVPGDIVILGSGDKVPADGRLLEGTNLLVNEAILTGEDEAVAKKPQVDMGALYMGTTVTWGNGIMKIERIGEQTEIGRIGKSLSEIGEGRTPIQESLASFAKTLLAIVFVICAIIFIAGILEQEDFWMIFRTAVVLSVAAIPEGLPVAVTIILTLGMRRILIKQGLVRKLLSIETLGSTSVICVDKTGTLTEGIMKVVKTDFTNTHDALFALTLVNTQRTNIEIALWDYVRQQNKFDPQVIFDARPKVYDEPFDSEKKYAVAVNQLETGQMGFVLGAPEIVLSFCRLEDKVRTKILNQIDDWASQGLRVLGLANKEQGDLREKKNYSWLGLVGIIDPVRQGAKEAIKAAQAAGIKIKIVTGDHRKTAEKVAKSLGFKITPDTVMDGNELEAISLTNLQKKIDKIVLFSRVLPHQKLKIVTALQSKGEITAMTGDGVNDAPALKKADIGVAMGTGTEVAKEVGDLILLDNNFTTIVAAVEEGRLIFANIKKVVSYVLSNSFAEIILIFGAIMLNFPLPLTVVQILWIQLICDGPPDILLGFETEGGLLKDKPRGRKREPILSRPTIFLIIAISSAIGLLSLALFWYYYKFTKDLALARTIAFAVIASVDLIYIFSFKNLKKPLWRTENFWQNKYLLWGVVYGFALVFLAIYLPALNRILGTTPLNPWHWLIVIGIAIISTVIVEIFKFIVNRKRR